MPDPRAQITGIYKIISSIDGRLYIGSSVDIFKRWGKHLRQLRRGKHENRYLQNAWAKYGKDNFIFEIIEQCEKDELIEREQFYIDFNKVADNGYNICPSAYSRVGAVFSEEHCIKLSIAAKNRPKRILSEEYKKKISMALKGRKPSPQTIAGLIASRKGKPLSPETREKLRISHLGEKHSSEYCLVMSNRIRAWWKERKEIGPACAA